MSSLVTYEDGEPFPGVIGRTTDESSPAWPTPPRAPDGAPNVVMFVLDDVGFGQLSSFGGLVETPVIDRFADNGLRYTNMHTTALCSPSRGAILTGRNHHSLGLATIAETSTGYPGYNAILPFDKGMLSEMLLPHGYNTFLVGKWHLSPPEHETPAGPYDRWPLGRGFERFYGFLGGDTNQWYPELVYDNHSVEQPAQPEDGYHLSADLADRAIEFIQDAHVNAPDKPFYLHYCTGAGHAPHHVAKEWADKYKGKFDAGWDEYRKVVHQRQLEMGIIPAGTELSAHDPDVPEWDTLPEDARKVFARMMEVYAGFVSYTDHQFGRVVSFLEEIGELDNTLFLLISDNGASSEGGPVGSLNEMMFFNNVPESIEENLERLDELGGPNVFNHYAWGWTNAGNTPFRRWKRETYRGGTTDPCIVSWPDKITARGEIRTQYGHIIDLVPTVLDALGITPPATIRGVTQAPIEGVSFAHTFNEADAATRHHTQYFEMFGHRAIYHDGWRAVCPWPGPSFTEAAQKGRHYGSPIDATVLADIEANDWELYDLTTDYAETKNVAAEHRDKVIEMVGRWWAEAGKYNVMPIDGSMLERMRRRASDDRQAARPASSTTPAGHRCRSPRRPRSTTAPSASPPTCRSPKPAPKASSSRTAAGSAATPSSSRTTGCTSSTTSSDATSSPSSPTPRCRPATSRSATSSNPPASPTSPPERAYPPAASSTSTRSWSEPSTCRTPCPNIFSTEGLTCGHDGGSRVAPDDYQDDFAFTGTLKRVTFDLSGDLIVDTDTDMKVAMARQ